MPASLCGVDEPDLPGVEDPEAGLAADESRTAAFAALGDCRDKAEEGRLVRLTAWLRPPMVICFGLLMLARAASSYLQKGSKTTARLAGVVTGLQQTQKSLIRQ